MNLDSRQNSPIVAIPVAKTMQHQSSFSYLRPMPNLPDGPGSEAHSDVLSTAGASDVPIIQQIGGHPRRKPVWSFFTKTNRTNNNDNNSDYCNNEISNSILCCSIQ